MSYRLEDHEPLANGVRRIAREQLDAALAHLRGETDADPDAVVHETRKAFKKVRAVLRLVRDEIGSDVYDRENTCLRDLGRRLSAVRDAKVLVATARKLRDGPAAEVPDGTFPALIDALEERRAEIRRDVLGEGAVLAEIETEAQAARGRIDGWPLDHEQATAFADGVERAYERGRKRFRKAYKKPDVERLHEWRKRVKYLWYHAQILEPAAPGELGALEATTDELADLLGLDHDFAVLGEQLDELQSRIGGPGAVKALRGLIDRRRFELQRQALPLGHRTYAERPKDFVRRVSALWESWQLEMHAGEVTWLTPFEATTIRELLAAKDGADVAQQRRIRRRLRDLDFSISEFDPYVRRRAGGFGPQDFDDLVRREIIRVGDASDLPRRPEPIDRTRRIGLEAEANEASAMCPLTNPAILEAEGWDLAFWVASDDVAVEDGIGAVGHRRAADTIADGWVTKRLPCDPGDMGGKTDDAEAIVRHQGWIIVLGSMYGSKRGPLEPERQFAARFRESEVTGALEDQEIEVEVCCNAFAVHRAVNDALRTSGPELWPLSARARAMVVEGAINEDDEDHPRPIEPADEPLNVEGMAIRPNGGVLLGLRVPATAEGHPVLVELAGIESLFTGELPEVKGFWTLEGIGNRAAPAGIRAMTSPGDDEFHVITGNLDSLGKDSILVEEHPEHGVARSAHFRFRLPGNRRSGSVQPELVRELPGLQRAEGISFDDLGRTFYVSDDDDAISLRYVEARPARA